MSHCPTKSSMTNYLERRMIVIKARLDRLSEIQANLLIELNDLQSKIDRVLSRSNDPLDALAKPDAGTRSEGRHLES